MTGILIFTIFVLTVFVLGAYTIVAPWWTTRAGKAYFIMFLALAILSGHFLLERLLGQQPQWVENVILGIVAGAIGWNGYTIISKQIRFWQASHETPNPVDPTRGHP